MRSTARIIAAVAIACLLAAGCGRARAPKVAADLAYAAFKDAYIDAKSPADRVALAEKFLAAQPGSDHASAVLGMAVDNLKDKLGDLARARSLTEGVLARTTDPETRFEMKLTLWEVSRAQGRPIDLRQVAGEIEAKRPLRFGELQELAEAALDGEQWALADGWSAAALKLATAQAYRAENPETTLTEAQVAERAKRRQAEAFADQGWAAFNLGRTEEAMTTFARAREVTGANFVGVAQTPLNRYWGEAFLRQGDLQRACELLAPDAVMAGDAKALAALRRAHVARTGGEAGFDEYLWSTRQQLARAAADFTLPTFTGEQVSLGSRKGKVVLLSFWFPT